jgi:hypothetical protein
VIVAPAETTAVLAAPKVRLSVPVESSVAVCVVVVPETIELPERRPTEFVVNVMLLLQQARCACVVSL